MNLQQLSRISKFRIYKTIEIMNRIKFDKLRTKMKAITSLYLGPN